MLVDPNAEIASRPAQFVNRPFDQPKTLAGTLSVLWQLSRDTLLTESGNKYHLSKPLCRALIPDAVWVWFA